MSLKAEIETWAAALELYDSQNFEQALATFEDIADSSKILFNIGLIYATIGEHEVAIENFRAATSLDQYLAVAYFQCGVSNFLIGAYEEAVKDFDDALLYLRSNLTIDYAQLGLKFRLYSCEVLFNKGLSLIYQGLEGEGMMDLEEARKEKQTPEHSVIDDAIADRAEGYTVFSIPVGVLYRPASSKLKNLASKNYLGQAKLVAATDASETFVGFTGSARAAAKNSSGLPISAAVSLSGSPSSSGIQRRGTTAARIEGTLNRMDPANDLQRRPSDIPTVLNSRLNRSATTNGGYRAGKLESLPERLGSDDERVRNDNGRSRGYSGGESQDSYGYEDRNSRGTPDERTSNWARNASTSSSTVSRGRGLPSTLRRPLPPGHGAYDDGYASFDEYPDTVASYSAMTKVRVKLHHGSDVRGMAVSVDMELLDFVAKVTKKFSLTAGSVIMKYKDEEGSMVSIMDDDDWESAIETARAYAKGRPEGKVEVWVED